MQKNIQQETTNIQLIDLFSGVAGFSLAGTWAGIKTVQFCETDDYCRDIIKKHFPDVPIHGDIHTLDYETIKKGGKWNPLERTIITGGFP